MRHETLQFEINTRERPTSQAEALEIAERCIALLKTRFGATRVIVFGSAAGQAPWHEGSDLDLAVEGIRPEEFFHAYSAVQDEAPRNLEIDLVELETAYPEMLARILGEVEMPDDPILGLKGLIADELKSLDRIVSQTDEIMAQRSDPPTWIEMSAMGKEIHDFYSAMESIFRRIAVQFDGGVPRTAQWHTDLLMQMNQAREGARPAVIDDHLWAWLDDFRSFRHFFRNAYAVPFEWNRLQLHIARMNETLAMLRSQLEHFFSSLQSDEKPS